MMVKQLHSRHRRCGGIQMGRVDEFAYRVIFYRGWLTWKHKEEDVAYLICGMLIVCMHVKLQICIKLHPVKSI